MAAFFVAIRYKRDAKNGKNRKKVADYTNTKRIETFHQAKMGKSA